jgi:NAD(P)H-hydrate repair Nnr-like enzyme with NAD(P)H-hydrate dehydratase domain
MSSRGTSDDDAGVRRSPPSASSSAPTPPPPFPTRWSDALADPRHRARAESLFPPLAPTAHKGSHGRVAIFGGSDRYAGAPYYAARSALVCGVDLVTIFCASEASVPIKCYSPELMVQAVYSVEEMDSLAKEEEAILRELEKCRRKQGNDLLTNEMNGMELRQTMKKLERSEEKQHLLIQSELRNDDRMEMLAERLAKMKSLEEDLQNLKARQEVFVDGIVDAITGAFPGLHAICIGPGLGRHPLVFSVAEKVMLGAIESRLMLILDADALFMLSLKEYTSLLGELRSYERCVMTPNLMEMRRLHDALSAGPSADGTEKRSNVIVQKGNVDTIMHDRYTMRCEEEGGLKRSGGIGDVLAGTITAFMAWNAILGKDETSDSYDINAKNDDTVYNEECQQRVFASWTAAILVKKATRIAFQKKKRSMSALDVIEEIGKIVSNMEDGLKSERSNLIQRTNCDVVHD